MEVWIIVLLVVSGLLLNIAMAILSGQITDKRGYGFLRGFVVGFAAPIIGFIGVINLEDRSGKEILPASQGMKGRDQKLQENIAKGVAKALEEQKDKIK